jgi:hypothetical protein
VHFVALPTVVIALAWLAAAAQLATLVAGRYGPYPNARERPRYGPVRSAVRRVVLAQRARRSPPPAEREAREG